MTDPGRVEAIVPQFTVRDVVETAEYYQDVWGFRIAGYWKDPPVFCDPRARRHPAFLQPGHARYYNTDRRVEGGYDVYLRVRGLDQLAARLTERGAAILEGPVIRDYGARELVVSDCNGLVLALGEDVPRATS